jgi:DNA-binding NarL/FixJ family response regulator
VNARAGRATDARATEPIRVLIVDDEDIFRSGLATLLVDEGVDVVGEAADADEAVSLVDDLAPDVVLMDIHLPGPTGVEATWRITANSPLSHVVILTISAEESDVVDAIMAGATGYVLKDAPMSQLIEAIRAAAAGDALISPSIAMHLLRRVRSRDDSMETGRAAEIDLSERELNVLKLIASGKDNAEIGRQLLLSPKTVKNQVTSILRKLQLENRIEAAVYAIRSGLV